ncbi:protein DETOXIFICATION 27 isoform X2 [Ricinus communis]|uniref:Protein DETOXIFICATION n=1 Tax=Ricinus communis TaxID=3988 RepID=B9RJS2_RICCO|nr:protein DETOXIFICATION 27 isoform X2 [Ricinus communis]EEF48574.1 multidrug resistance pump, putative [Ricinus communis]|eukprot:XP_002513991.1 protein DETOXIFICATION 27 [Ricinus communis]
MGIREEQRYPLLLSVTEEEDGPQQLPCQQCNGIYTLVQETWLESIKIWEIAGPSIFSRLAMFSMTVITQAFAGHLSDINLAAISIATTVIIAVSFGFLLGMASALETLCGQAYGAKQYHILGLYMQRSWIVLFLCSILLLPMFLFATPILKLIGQPEEVAEQTGLVAIWLIPFHFSFPFQFTLQRFLQSQLQTGVIALVSGGALLIHVFVSWVFVYKLRVGIVGTAITLDFSWWVSVLGMFVYCVCGGCPVSWTGFSTQAFVGLWPFFKLSAASGIMLLFENLYYRVLIIISGYLQETEVAVDALSICISIYAWESMIPLGFLAATGVRVANELGAGNAKGAKIATTVSILTSLVIGLFFFLIIMAFSEQLAMLFTSSSSVIAMVNELAVLLAFTILLNCIQPVLSGVAVGCGWQALVAFINIGSYYIVGVPLGVCLGWLLHFGFTGIWAGLIIGTVVQTLILTIVTMKCEWEKEAEKARLHITNGATFS